MYLSLAVMVPWRLACPAHLALVIHGHGAMLQGFSPFDHVTLLSLVSAMLYQPFVKRAERLGVFYRALRGWVGNATQNTPEERHGVVGLEVRAGQVKL